MQYECGKFTKMKNKWKKTTRFSTCLILTHTERLMLLQEHMGQVTMLYELYMALGNILDKEQQHTGLLSTR